MHNHGSSVSVQLSLERSQTVQSASQISHTIHPIQLSDYTSSGLCDLSICSIVKSWEVSFFFFFLFPYPSHQINKKKRQLSFSDVLLRSGTQATFTSQGWSQIQFFFLTFFFRPGSAQQSNLGKSYLSHFLVVLDLCSCTCNEKCQIGIHVFYLHRYVFTQHCSHHPILAACQQELPWGRRRKIDE